jgi:hypothetical protein
LSYRHLGTGDGEVKVGHKVPKILLDKLDVTFLVFPGVPDQNVWLEIDGIIWLNLPGS